MWGHSWRKSVCSGASCRRETWWNHLGEIQWLAEELAGHFGLVWVQTGGGLIQAAIAAFELQACELSLVVGLFGQPPLEY